jgi:hypothetical protein
MARAPKLKVFRLPIGFHDAFVAAPSQKAAIEAWGSDKDVFRRGQAEQVTDPALTREPLDRPGEVIKRLRGTAAEQLAALADEPEQTPTTTARGGSRPKPAKKAKPRPKPSRGRVEAAEAALAAADSKHSTERKALAEREAALARERRALEARQRREREGLEARLGKAEDAYRDAIRRWRG